jgi:hypothetical protein
MLEPSGATWVQKDPTVLDPMLAASFIPYIFGAIRVGVERQKARQK